MYIITYDKTRKLQAIHKEYVQSSHFVFNVMVWFRSILPISFRIAIAAGPDMQLRNNSIRRHTWWLDQIVLWYKADKWYIYIYIYIYALSPSWAIWRRRKCRKRVSKYRTLSGDHFVQAAMCQHNQHYNDVIMGTMASQITSPTIVYSAVHSGAYQRKHQSSASLAIVRGIHR